MDDTGSVNSQPSYIKYDSRSECSGSEGLTWQEYMSRANIEESLFNDLSQLDKEEKIKELEKNLSSHEKIAKECADEYEYSLSVVKELWRSIENILKNNKEIKVDSRSILNYFFNLKCIDDESFRKILWLDDNVEYNWIEDWKKSKAYTVGRTGIFTGMRGIDKFKKNVSAGTQTTKSLTPDFDENDILAPNRSYLESRYKSLQIKPNIGILRVDVEQNKIDSLIPAMNELVIRDKKVTKINCDYNIDDLLQDINNKLNITLSEQEQLKIKDEINTNKSNPSSILAMIKKVTQNNVINEAAVIDQTYRVGSESKQTNSGKNIIGSEYSQRVEWIPPYTDPHFSYLSNNVEYWVPKVHMVSGLPVWKEKDEVKRNIKKGSKVYVKLQTVKVKDDNNKTVYLDYFRKFIDFNDFLKSWQESYVKKYLDIGKMIIDKPEIKLLERRQIILKRIKDIKEYFNKESSENPNEEKLKMYISDEVVDSVINNQPDQPEIYAYNEGTYNIKEYIHMLYPNSFEPIQGRRKSMKLY